MCQTAQERRGCGGSHELERLSDGGEAGNLVGGRFNVIEAHDGDIARDVEAGVVESADTAHGCDVVEA